MRQATRKYTTGRAYERGEYLFLFVPGTPKEQGGVPLMRDSTKASSFGLMHSPFA